MATAVSVREYYWVEERAKAVPVLAPFDVICSSSNSIKVECWREKFLYGPQSSNILNSISGGIEQQDTGAINFNIFTGSLKSKYKYVGQTCMFLFARAARERNLDLICDANMDAVRFYQKMGFVIDNKHYDQVPPGFKKVVTEYYEKISQEKPVDFRLWNIFLRLDHAGFEILTARHLEIQQNLGELHQVAQ